MSNRLFTFHRSVRIECAAADAFAWHERPGALERLTPPWEKVQVESSRGGIRDGGQVVLRTRVGPTWQRWRAEHRDYVPGVQFRDVQQEGPFARFDHLHRFESLAPSACELHDVIHYELPGRSLASWARGVVERRLERLFRYRHQVTKADLERPARPPGRVLISGASGLLGQALSRFLSTQGWDVLKLVRRAVREADEVEWDPANRRLEWATGRTVDALVHLAGANLAEGRWTAQRKIELRQSRLESTRLLVEAMRRGQLRPSVFVSGSAIGYYGDGGETVLPETAGPGQGFLAQLCVDWEQAATEAGTRTVLLRTGVVVTPEGGALAKLLPVFRTGLGGRLGSGCQWMSWIAVDDWVDVVARALTDPRLAGPVNVVAPHPVRNAEFAAILGRVLRRPARLPVPAVALRAAVGPMADEALLQGARVQPAQLLALGHTFRFAELEAAFRHGLGRV